MNNTTIMGCSLSLPMNGDVIAAYERLQGRLLKSTSYSLIERYERALNELINHPERNGNPNKLANAAYGNAGKVVRSHMHKCISYDEHIHDKVSPDSIADYSAIEWRSLIDIIYQPGRENTICQMLLKGYDVKNISLALGITEINANVLISRIRKKNSIAARKMSLLS